MSADLFMLQLALLTRHMIGHSTTSLSSQSLGSGTDKPNLQHERTQTAKPNNEINLTLV